MKSTKVNTCVVKESDVIVERLLRFSSWHKAKVAVALCLKYKRKLREKVMSKGKESSAGSQEQRCVSNTPASAGLNVANLQEAEVEQRVLATVTSKNQVDSAKKKFQGWRCGIAEGKPVSEKQMAFG